MHLFKLLLKIIFSLLSVVLFFLMYHETNIIWVIKYGIGSLFFTLANIDIDIDSNQKELEDRFEHMEYTLGDFVHDYEDDEVNEVNEIIKVNEVNEVNEVNKVNEVNEVNKKGKYESAYRNEVN
jgi:hypothetical protein